MVLHPRYSWWEEVSRPWLVDRLQDLLETCYGAGHSAAGSHSASHWAWCFNWAMRAWVSRQVTWAQHLPWSQQPDADMTGFGLRMSGMSCTVTSYRSWRYFRIAGMFTLPRLSRMPSVFFLSATFVLLD